MEKYDPSVAPNAQEWLSLDEQERLDLVREYHKAAGIRPPRQESHASAHVIVENQLAMGLEAVVVAYHRLLDQGLNRHDALHAIGSVMMDHINEIWSGRLDRATPGELNERYDRELSELTAEKWRREYGVS